MTIVIIPEDKVAEIDGVYRKFDTVLVTDVHALKWDGRIGAVEYRDKKGHSIDDFTPYQPLLDSILIDYAAQDVELAAKAVLEAEAKAAEQVLIDEQRLRLKEPQSIRDSLYPSSEVHLRALYKARAGDDSDLLQLDIDIAQIDFNNPL